MKAKFRFTFLKPCKTISVFCFFTLLLLGLIVSCKKEDNTDSKSHKRISQYLIRGLNGSYSLKTTIKYSGNKVTEIHHFTPNSSNLQFEESHRYLFEYPSSDSAVETIYNHESSGKWVVSQLKSLTFAQGEIVHSETRQIQAGIPTLIWKWDREYGINGLQSEMLEEFQDGELIPYRNDIFYYDSTGISRMISSRLESNGWKEAFIYNFSYEDGMLKKLVTTPGVFNQGMGKTLREYSNYAGKVMSIKDFTQSGDGTWEDAKHTFFFTYDADGYLKEWTESQNGVEWIVSITYETGEGNYIQMAEASTDNWIIYNTLPQPE